MIFYYLTTQTVSSLIPRTYSSTAEMLHSADRYVHAMLAERERRQRNTRDVTDLDELAIMFMVDLLKKPQLPHPGVMANEAYCLAQGGIAIEEKYAKDWEARCGI